jgi:hypothetical protein
MLLNIVKLFCEVLTIALFVTMIMAVLLLVTNTI